MTTFVTPLVSEAVASGDSCFSPLDFPVDRLFHFRPESALEVTKCMGNVSRQHGVSKIADLPEAIANCLSDVVNWVSCTFH